MSDENENAIDWKQATDEQLADAAAELKARRPLTDFDNLKWPEMSDTEFEQNKEQVFKAMRAHARGRRILKEHSEFEAEKESRANG